MAEYKMEGAELASMKKGQLSRGTDSKNLQGIDDSDLYLSEEKKKWWRDAKFGLFIHWGVYSVIGKGEWAYFNENYTEEEYRKIAETSFHPNRTPGEIAGEWIRAAQAAGMKYAVMVTRHHDGYALWDSQSSWKEFTSVKCGPEADYVAAFVKACRENHMYTGLYYSPMDWRFPGYFDPEGKPESAARMKEQTYRQVEELATSFGKIDILWYDGGWLAHRGTDADAAWFWEPVQLNRMLRAHQPDILVNPRSGYSGDFQCQEGAEEIRGGIVPVPWEKCMSISTAWGYRPGDVYKKSEALIRMLADAVCRDGNLLLNVGPDFQGRIPQQAKEVLWEVGKWLSMNGEAVYGTRGGIWQPVDGVFGSTYRDGAVYVHILDCEAFRNVYLPMSELPQGCRIQESMLLDGRKVDVEEKCGGIRLLLPKEAKWEHQADTVVKLLLS